MLSLKQPLQPFIIAVGQDLTCLTHFYIRFDAVTYQIPSLLRALDILYKIYIIYKVRYPLESTSVSYFIQWGVYKVSTEEDVKVPFVYNILNQLKQRKD